MEHQESIATYDEPTSSERWLILNDNAQDFPTEAFTVEKFEKIIKTGGTKAMPLLTLKGVESGSTFLTCAWERDVKKCILEYGKTPTTWGQIRLTVEKGRRQFIPVTPVLVEETVTQ